MPTDEQRALWSAIRANPLDDTPRLVYADWLQEHGDEARAEFIRVQCALEKLGPDRRKGRKQRVPLEKRQTALLRKYQHAWLAPFRARLDQTEENGENEWLEEVAFRRGFLNGWRFNLETARLLAAAGDELEPVDRVGVWEMAMNYHHASVVTVAKWSGAGCVVGFSIARASDKDVTAIVRHDYMRNLTLLGLWDGTVSDKGVEILAACPHVGGLTHLNLADNPITNAGALALAKSPNLSALVRLALHGTRIGKKGARALLDRFGAAVGIDTEI